MKKIIPVFMFKYLILITVCNAQIERGSNWITGYSGSRINFSNSTITTTHGIYFPFKHFHSGNSCISDTNGNIVISTNGMSVFNNNGNIIESGDTIVSEMYFQHQSGNSFYSQTSIILSLDGNKYYLITPTYSDARYIDCYNNNGNCYFDLLLYNLIDMNANAGSGKVIKRMMPLMQNANLRKTQMMACRHGNGKDWWLLKNEGDSANIHVFLFTQDSVYDKGVQVFNDPVWGAWDIRGQSTFNSDGSLFATTSDGSGSLASLGLILLADFDRCWGKLNNPRVLDMPWGSQHNPNDTTLLDKQSVGLCFSPNSKFLYVISYTNVYQYDLQDSTWFHVAGLDTIASAAQGYETAYIGPDDKIYIGNFGGTSKQMSRIDNPDFKGAGCSFCPRCLRLDSLGANAYVGTPPCMPNYSLGAKTCWPLQIENMNENEWVVYPNPASELLYVKGNFKEKVSVTLLDITGSIVQKNIFDPTNSILQIKVNYIKKGIYLLKVSTAGGGDTFKKVAIE